MTDVSLAALLDAVPQRGPGRGPSSPDGGPLETWVGTQLQCLWPRHAHELAGRHVAGRSYGWAVGSVIGNETLVQSRPLVADGAGAFLGDFLRAEARGTLAALTCAEGGGRPEGAGIARYHRWVAAVSHFQELREQREPRDALLAALPDFLVRARQDRSLPELLLFSVLARLHGAGELGSAYADPAEIRRALLDFERGLDDRGLAPVNLLLFDGRTFAASIHHERLWSVSYDHGGTPRRSLVHGTSPATRLFALADAPPQGQDELSAERTVEIPAGIFSIDPRAPEAVTRT